MHKIIPAILLLAAMAPAQEPATQPAAPKVQAHATEFENLLLQSVQLRAEIATVLESVQDAASANAALPALWDVMARYEDVSRAMKALPRPDAESFRQMEQRHLETFRPVRQRLMANLMRLVKAGYYGDAGLQRALSPLVRVQAVPAGAPIAQPGA